MQLSVLFKHQSSLNRVDLHENFEQVGPGLPPTLGTLWRACGNSSPEFERHVVFTQFPGEVGRRFKNRAVTWSNRQEFLVDAQGRQTLVRISRAAVEGGPTIGHLDRNRQHPWVLKYFGQWPFIGLKQSLASGHHRKDHVLGDRFSRLDATGTGKVQTSSGDCGPLIGILRRGINRQLLQPGCRCDQVAAHQIQSQSSIGDFIRKIRLVVIRAAAHTLIKHRQPAAGPINIRNGVVGRDLDHLSQQHTIQTAQITEHGVGGSITQKDVLGNVKEAVPGLTPIIRVRVSELGIQRLRRSPSSHFP